MHVQHLLYATKTLNKITELMSRFVAVAQSLHEIGRQLLLTGALEMATASELRQILKEDAVGQNLYDHLTETLMKIMIDRPKNAYDSFELISSQVKGNPLNPDPLKGKPLPPSAAEV
jgi:hypothetical protein